MSDELREAIERLIHEGIVKQWHGTMRDDVALTDPRPIVRDLLAGPLAPLLAKLGAVEALADGVRRVEALCDVADDQPDGYECGFIAVNLIRDALAGESR